MTLGYCEDCGVPLDEWDSCSYGNVCMSCWEREHSPCNYCTEDECYDCEHYDEENY